MEEEESGKDEMIELLGILLALLLVPDTGARYHERPETGIL